MKLLTLLLCALPAFAQPWSGIISTSRAINWANAGLPATLPDGEVTANPWTPPVRTQCAAYSGYPAAITGTGTGSIDAPALNAALVACSQGSGRNGVYIPVTGTFSFAGTVSGSASCYGGTSYYCLELYAANGVTLRGAGPQSTFIDLTGASTIVFGESSGSGSCTWSGGYTAGATSITVSGCTGPTLAVGNVITLQQCDTGFSGASCTTGAAADNGGIFVCGLNTVCQRSGEGTGNQPEQQQMALVTSVTGSGTLTVGIASPGLYMPNWTSAQSPTITWTNGPNGSIPYGDGLEDLTVYATSSTQNEAVYLNNSYASWIKGVRFVGAGINAPLYLQNSKNCLVLNNLLFSDPQIDSNYPAGMQEGGDSDNLVLNNMFLSGVVWNGTGEMEGNVFAYNYTRDNFTGYVLDVFEHSAGDAFQLYEGNQTPDIQEDDTHGTHDLQTAFRNQLPGWNAPYVSSNFASINWDYADRFSNVVGNVMGGTQTSCYKSVWLQHCGTGYIYSLDETSSAHNDNGLTASSTFMWANYDTVSNAVRYCGPGFSGFTSAPCSGSSATGVSVSEASNTITVTSTLNPNLASGVKLSSCSVSGYNGVYYPLTTSGSSFTVNSPNTSLGSGTCTVTTNTEVPEALPGNASALANAVPSSSTLPASFFLPTTAHPSGGTGLSWWKTCASWTTFPTNCASYTTPPFPAAGPDVSGGPNINGYAYNVPAQVAWVNLPIDTAYQGSYSITASSWAGGVETLTIAALPNNSVHIMGPFQISGGACSTGSGESYITTSTTPNGTSSQITYALASNPGSCTSGQFLFPDVRQFDERVYSLDNGGAGVPSSVFGLFVGAVH